VEQSQGGQAVKNSTISLINALRVLDLEIESDDGVANAVIAEAAQRLEEQQDRITQLENENDAMRADLLLWRETVEANP
jgi:hypothetical protein